MIERERCEADRMHRANEVDQRMAALVTQKNRVMAEMIPLVHEIERDRLFSALGETSVTNYMRKRACWEKSKTEKVVALARKLEHLPHLREALALGDLPWTKAYVAALAATPETDAEWTRNALAMTNEQLEAERARLEGRTVVERVTLSLTASELAAVDEAVTAVRHESTKNLSFAEAVTEACKRTLEGCSAGGAKHRVVVYYCAGCHKAAREGKNGPVEISHAELETIACDAELHDMRGGEKALSRTIPPKVSNFVQARDHGRCRVPGCKNRAHLNLHHEGGWRTVGHDARFVMLLCFAHHQSRHNGDLAVRALVPGRFEFLRRDGRSLGTVDLSLPPEPPGGVTFRPEGLPEGPPADTFRTEGSAGDTSRTAGDTFRTDGPDTFRTEGPAEDTFRTEGPDTFRMDGPDTFRAEGPAEDAFRTEGPPEDTFRTAEDAFRTEGLPEDTFRTAEDTLRTEGTEGPAGDTLRTDGPPGETPHAEGPARLDLVAEAAFAVAALRKLEFRKAVARELVMRVIRSGPLEHGTAEEILAAALRLVESPSGAR